MELFDEYLERIGDPRHRARIQEVLAWVAETFPELTPRIAWSQPMFTHHGTFIIGFSTAKNHLAIAPERAGLERFSEDIRRPAIRTASSCCAWNGTGRWITRCSRP